MKGKVREIEEKIEKMREQLYQTYKSDSRADELLRLSQELDNLLNEYENMSEESELTKN